LRHGVYYFHRTFDNYTGSLPNALIYLWLIIFYVLFSENKYDDDDDDDDNVHEMARQLLAKYKAWEKQSERESGAALTQDDDVV